MAVSALRADGWQAGCVRRRVRIGLSAVAAMLVVAGCTSSTSSSFSPTASRCEIAATLSAASFASEGGAGTVAVTAERDCAWSIATDAAWVVVEGPSQGQGGTSVPYRVSPNVTPIPRRATVAIEARRLEVAQAGAPCRFQVDRSRIDFGSGSGTALVRVTAMNGCAWTAGSRDAWITLRATSGSGSADVTVGVAPNPAAARQGTVVVAGQTVTVNQSGAASSDPLPPPTPPSPPDPPPPSPPAEPTVNLDGRVSSSGGACPNVQFVLDGHSVRTDASTNYRKGGCRHVTNGAALEVRGRRDTAGHVRAEQVTIVERAGEGR